MKHTSNKNLNAIFLLLISLSLNHPCWAQSDEQKKTSDASLLNSLYGDFDTPDLTAPTLLGVSTNQVTKPANVKAFAASIFGAGASFPEVGKGVGIEIAPVHFFQTSVWKAKKNEEASLAYSLNQYRKPINQVSRGFTISVAQASTDLTARVAIGGAVVLFDKTDPLLDNYYNNTLIQQIKKRDTVSKLHRSFNGNFTTKRSDFASITGIFPTINSYYSGPPAELAKAQERNTEFEALLGTIGLLPDLAQSNPLQKPEDFNKQQDQALADLKIKLARDETYFTTNQKAAIIILAEKETADVKAFFTQFESTVLDFYTATNVLVKAARDSFESRRWNAPVGQIGGGWTWASTDKRYSTLAPQSSGIYARTAFRLHSTADSPYALEGFEHFLYWHTQLIADFRYSNYRSKSDLTRPEYTLPDSLDQRFWYGLRLLVGGASFRLSGEGSIQNLTYSQMAQSAAQKVNKQLPGTIYSATIGAEIRVVDNIWFEFAIGSAKPAGQTARLLTIGSLKYALRNSQRFRTN